MIYIYHRVPCTSYITRQSDRSFVTQFTNLRHSIMVQYFPKYNPSPALACYRLFIKMLTNLTPTTTSHATLSTNSLRIKGIFAQNGRGDM